jgi:hypothetical protein
MIQATPFRIFALTTALAAVACGDDTEPTPLPALPEQPQVLPNTAFGVFPVLEPGDSDTITIQFNNGGQQDLVFTSITLEQPGDDMTLTLPALLTAVSRESVAVTIEHAPSARGAYIARLVGQSNAQNFPTIEVEIVGTGSATPRPLAADVLVYEDPTPVIAEFGIAFMRFRNVGRNTLTVTSFGIENDTGEAFELAAGVNVPTEAVPTYVGPGALLGIQINFVATTAGTHTADFVLESDDEDEPVLSVGLTGTVQ